VISRRTNLRTRGTKKAKYLEENIAAAKVKLSPDDLKLIRTNVEKVEVVGERYPPGLAMYSFGDTPEFPSK
jgi:hypothetical protein